MHGLLESWGVHIASVQLASPQIEAASLFEEGAVPVIVLNRAHPRCRLPLARRALLAHELCHLLHDGGTRELLTVVSRDVSDDPIEARANGFAPSFLAPQPWVRPRSSEVYDLVVEVASRWGLSYEGGVYHAKNLGLVDRDVAKVLLSRPVNIDASPFEQMPTRLVAADGLSPAPLVDGLVSDLAIEAQAADLISRGRLAEILELA
ncbi:MAG: ImmA/IrrE family metallo-endopeptidase [Myxococcales bacterium]|nr:ImmA/IrrE family metallo-endopeptidase [Myxococcales bacterium]